MRTLFAILLLLISSHARAAEARLLMAIYEHDPWMRVTPTLMLYEDGTLLYAPLPAGSTWLRRQVNDPTRWLAERLSTSLAEEKRRYSVTSNIHAMTTVVWTPDRSLTVIGDWRRPEQIGSAEARQRDPRLAQMFDKVNEQQRVLWSRLPSGTRETLKRFDHERAQAGEAWMAPQLEIHLLPADTATGDFPSWPRDWPSHEDWATRTCNQGEEAYTLQLPGNLAAPLRSLLQSNPRDIFVINGRKMHVNAHAVLAGEAQWLPECANFQTFTLPAGITSS